MKTTDTVLVTGATGNTGSQIVRALLAQGVPVRATIQREADRARLPAEVTAHVADFDHPASMAAALDGVRRAYLVTPSSEKAERQQLDFVATAKQQGVERIVLLSQLGARVDSPVRFLRYHAVVEDAVRAAGLEHAFLRPNLYLQGLFALLPEINATGTFHAPIGAAGVSAIDVRDIAEVAAAALTEDQHREAAWTLTGPAAVTHEEIAAALSEATGRTIAYADTTPERFAASLSGVLPPWQVDGLVEDYAHYARGEAAEVTDAVEVVTGAAPRSLATFAHDHADAFAEPASRRPSTSAPVLTQVPGARSDRPSR